MKVELWPVSKPKPYGRNPRQIPQKAIEKIGASLKTYGFRQPIVVDRKGVIVVGHARLKAAEHVGLTKVPVHMADTLSPGQIKAYRLADNRVAQETDWDMDALKIELADLKDLDFDLASTGFDMPELNRLLTDPDEIERAEKMPPLPVRAVTRRGDVWLLGKHRLVCGDATNTDDVAAALNKRVPHIMITDPPYGVAYDPEWRDGADLGVGERSRGKVQNDDRADWTEAWALFPGEVAYVWHASQFVSDVQRSLSACQFEVRAQIIWRKQHFALSRGDYHWQHEPCWYAVKRSGKSYWTGDRKQSTIWDIANNNSFGNADHERTWGHGTQKPIECMRRPMLNNSQPGALVYDPFLGSGTTLIAAEMEGRLCCGLELDPLYADVIIQRWQDYSGREAMLEATRQTYEELRDVRFNTDKSQAESQDEAVRGKAQKQRRKTAKTAA